MVAAQREVVAEFVLEAAAEMNLDTRLIARMGLPETWIYQDERKNQLAEAGIDAASIARMVREVLDAQPSRDPVEIMTVPARAAVSKTT